MMRTDHAKMYARGCMHYIARGEKGATMRCMAWHGMIGA